MAYGRDDRTRDDLMAERIEEIHLATVLDRDPGPIPPDVDPPPDVDRPDVVEKFEDYTVTEAKPRHQSVFKIPAGTYSRLEVEMSVTFPPPGWPGPTTNSVILFNAFGKKKLFAQVIAKDPSVNGLHALMLRQTHANGEDGGQKRPTNRNLQAGLRFREAPLHIFYVYDYGRRTTYVDVWRTGTQDVNLQTIPGKPADGPLVFDGTNVTFRRSQKANGGEDGLHEAPVIGMEFTGTVLRLYK